jgi:ABC-2 type transport system ATP-binding protein
MLEVRNLSKSYGSFRALNDISINVPASAKIVGIIGPNGAGKTTLLEAMAGLLPVDSGQVTCNGSLVAPNARNRTLFYFSDTALPDYDRTVGETIRFYSALYKIEAQALERVMAELEMKPLLGKRLFHLSKGFKKRVLLALAWLVPHPLVILDEPFDGLDFKQTKRIIDLFQARKSEKKTFILSIHQLADAERVCDYFILLNQGRVLSQGTQEQVLRRGASSAATLEEVFLALT